MRKRKCPYCGKKISYFFAMNHKIDGEFFCNKCQRTSKIALKKAAIILFIFLILISLLMFFVFLSGMFMLNFYGLFLIALPFLIYYFMIPSFLAFLPLKKYKNEIKKSARQRKEPKYDDNYEYDPPKPVDLEDTEFDSDVFSRVKEIRERKYNTMDLENF